MSVAADVFLLEDPELYLPAVDDHALGHAGTIIAIGSFRVTVDNPRDLLRLRTQHEAELRPRIQTYQAHITTPCKVLIEWRPPLGDEVTIYGDLKDAQTAYGMERASGADHAEAKLLKRRILDAERRGWLWGRFYSQIEPTGEMGCTHRCYVAHVLTEDEWTTAQAEGWPA